MRVNSENPEIDLRDMNSGIEPLRQQSDDRIVGRLRQV